MTALLTAAHRLILALELEHAMNPSTFVCEALVSARVTLAKLELQREREEHNEKGAP